MSSGINPTKKFYAALACSFLLFQGCVAWPLLTGAVGLAAGKKGGGGLFFLPGGGTPTLSRVEISSPNSSFAKTTSMSLVATAAYSNGTHKDITADAVWSSSDSNIISLAAGGQATGTGVGSADISITYENKTALISLSVTSAPLSTISISCINQTDNLPKGITRQCTLTGNFADGSNQDLTNDPNTTWSTGSSTVATIDSAGLVTAVNAGTTSIQASYNSFNANNLTLTVSSAALVSIAVTPTNKSLALGKTQQYTATGTYSDNSNQDITNSVTWNSSDTVVATISNTAGSRGFLSTEDMGTSTITATLNSIGGNTDVTVTAAVLESISITSPTSSFSTPKGRTLNLVATGIFSDGHNETITDQVTWSSEDNSIATVDNGAGFEGRASGIAVGTVDITAEIGGIEETISFSVTAAVLESIQLTADDSSIAKGTSTAILATGVYSDGTSQNITGSVSWSSSSTSILQLGTLTATPKKLVNSPNNGSLGTSTITATSGSISGTVDITVTAAKLVSIAVTPTNPSVAKGLTKDFTATGTYTDSSTQDLTTSVTWASSDTSKATISNAAGTEGKATAAEVGTTNITATLGTITSPSTTLTVTAAVLQSITITPSNPSVAKGRSENLSATGTYSDNSTQDLTTSVTWSSSSNSTVGVSNVNGTKGKATAVSVGTATITATLGSVSNSITFTVTSAVLDSIEVHIMDSSIAKGTSTLAVAEGTYSDGTSTDITDQVVWGSSQTSIVQLGVLTAAPKKTLTSPNNGSLGTSTISATIGSISGTANLTVTAATLVSIQVDPTNPSVAKGLTQNFTATGTYTDASTQDLTTSVTWASSSTSKATISNAGGSNGLATTLATGTTNITATLGSVTSPASVLTVTAAALTSITIAPAPTLSIAKGRTQNFTATGHYTDSSTSDLTTQVTWSSFDQTKATVSNTSGTNGRLTALQEGSTQISASYNSVTSTDTAVTVTAAVLDSISITPTNSSLAKGYTTPFTANGVYSDATTLDITTQVTWASSNTSSSTISNASGTEGIATAVAVGTSTISATLGSVSSSTNFTVTAAVLVSIAVSPTNSNVYTTQTKDFTATGTYSDSSTQNLTTSVTWASSDTSKATISNASGTEGRATGVAAGTITISATSGSVSGNTQLTVVFLDTTAPIVSNVVSLSPTTIRVTFSESVNTTQATTAANYKLALTSAVSGSCSDNSNFSSTSNISVSSVSGSGAIYTLTLASSQTSGTNYTVIVNKSGVQDLSASPNNLGCANYGDFVGQEQLKVSSASCASTSTVIINFSKPIKSGNNVSNSAECSSTSECANRYSFFGTTSLGTISSAKILDGVVCGGATADSAKVCVTHSLLQTGAQYTIIAANNVNGDGFDNTSWGSIRDSGDSENIQSSPRDRASFLGCGTSPVNFEDGPISVDPNGSTFGYLADFNSKIYTGPNNAGNGALRFAYDGSNPESVQFSFVKDTNGQNSDTSNVSSNSATTRENSIAVPPYVTLGHSGCTQNDATLANGCGPDNESGRGLFTTGSLSSNPFIFIAAAKTVPSGSNYNFDYIYYSNDTSTNLNYKYIDMGSITGTVTAGTSSISVLNDRVFPGFAKPSNDGTGTGGGLNAPDFGYITFNSADSGGTGNCTAGSNCDAYDGSNGRRIRIDYMPYFGGPSAGGNGNINNSPNWGYYIGVDSSIVFKNRIYAANGGLHAVGHNGSIIRSNSSSPTTACASKNTCADWTEVGPRTNTKWHNSTTNNWFSLELAKFYDLIPGDRAFAQFAEYNDKLYVTRTICIQGTQASGIRTAAGTVSGCTDGTDTNRRAQLWKCDPTATGGSTECDAGDWSVVGDDGNGITNFGDTTNKTITMVAKNGSYLYVGFDNPNGIRIYRTNTANPGSASNVWTQVASGGLTDSTNVQQIFSAVSVNTGGVYYLYVSVGKNNTPVRVYRQQNL